MAFATIEDIQGSIDLVIFPRTWKKYGELVNFDEIIFVKGKTDANGGEPKVLVDEVLTRVLHLESQVENPPPAPETPLKTPPEPVQKSNPSDKESKSESGPSQTKEHNQGPILPQPEPGARPKMKTPENLEPNIPSEPDPFPPEWEEEFQLKKEKPLERQPDSQPEPKPASLTLDEDATYLITLVIRNRGDQMRDKLLLRQVYGTLISYPGEDRFVFQILENDQVHLLEFPDATTRLSKQLLNQLRDILGVENVQYEKYLL